MALKVADRVLETCTSPGTGAVTLLGATVGYQTFSAAIGNANTTYYTIADQSGANWEVGIGTYTTSGNTLTRNTVLSSSNGGSLTNFNSGTQNVFVTYPSENAVYTSNGPGTSGYVLVSSGAGAASVWTAPTSVVGGAAGSNTQVQYNSSGSLAGSANMVFDGTTITSAFSGPHNGTVGATTASTGAFTTLSASSTVSGTGFTNYFASPPALGGTAAAAVFSTNLSYTGTLTGGTGVVNLGSGQFYKDASGNVGLGTASPSSYGGLLNVVSTTAGSAKINISDWSAGASPAPLLQFGVNSSNGFVTADAARVWASSPTSTTAALNFAAYNGGAPSTAQITLTGGNVGIGTSSPQFKLDLTYGDVTGPAMVISGGRTAGGVPEILFKNSYWVSGNVGAASIAAGDNGFAGGFIAFKTTTSGSGTSGVPSERMRIDSSGNLLVGTTSASAGSRFFVKSGGNTLSTNNTVWQNSSATSLGYIRDDGLWNTGTAASSPYNYTTGSASNLFIDSNGILYRSTSSIKYKTDVQDATHGLAEVLKLRSVTYKCKTDGDTVFGGLIAEEVHEAGLTEFVQYAKDGSPDALAYGQMVSLLAKAIQEQQAMIENLTTRLTALENK